MTAELDYLLVGGGLQNGLIALAIRAQQPAARIAMVEQAPALGGNHTWCFHDADVDAAAALWIAPLVVARWDGYDVAFADHRRTLSSGYACVSSERLAACVARALDVPGSTLLTRTTAVAVHADHATVRNPDGTVRELRARVVIAARGPDGADVEAGTGWQKFVGQELVLDEPHGLARPMLMDATVRQDDGFRFFYLLPFAPDRVLVEDTRFADGAHLDLADLRAEIAAYVAARGWRVARVAREEHGVLALPFRPRVPQTTAPLCAGYHGGWFHPVTGYSFPIAARLAAFIAGRPADALFGAALDEHARAHGKQLDFAGRLNRLLFRWFAPPDRHHVLARFYRLPETTIRRFYALQTTAFDRAAVFIGRPPRGFDLRRGLEAS